MKKPELRMALRAARQAFVAELDAGELAAEAQALARQVAPLLAAGHVVATYSAQRDEIDAGMAALAATRHGAALAFPRVDGERLVFHLADFDSLVPGYRGLLEPAADAPQATPDIVLVPLVGVDSAGNRLGQGAGHYDRTLAALRRRGGVTVIGLGWDMQLVPRIPADPWDQRLDWVATPRRLVDSRASR